MWVRRPTIEMESSFQTVAADTEKSDSTNTDHTQQQTRKYFTKLRKLFQQPQNISLPQQHLASAIIDLENTSLEAPSNADCKTDFGQHKSTQKFHMKKH